MMPPFGACLLLVLIIGPGTIAYGEERAETLTLERAHELALLNAPRISLAQLQAVAALDEVAVERSAYLPQLTGVMTMVRASSGNTRIEAGALNNPSIYDREAAGVVASQLITDFGLTTGRIDAARMHSWAESKRSQASIDEILLEVDLEYYRTLQSQSRVIVAEQTVKERQQIAAKVTGMVENKLKSELDQSFAQVNLEEGRMLEAQVRNELTINNLTLSTLLGFDIPQPFILLEHALAPPSTQHADELVAQALRDNPAIARLRFEISSTMRAYDAERALDYPTVSAIGVAGVSVDRDPRLASSYAAGGFNLSIPLYSGNLIATRQHEAELRMQLAKATLRIAENDLSRDVRVAIANVTYTYARLDMAGKLLVQAGLSYDLAKSRFDLGLTSIVDLEQADLSRTSASMTESAVKQDYLIQLAVLDNRLGVHVAPAIAPTQAGQR
jgi:outer membrane protein